MAGWLVLQLLLVALTNADYNENLKVKQADFAKLEAELVEQLKILQADIEDNVKITENKNALVQKVENYKKNLTLDNNNFLTKLTVDFDKKVTEGLQSTEKYMEDDAVPNKYDQYFKSLFTDMEKRKASYDTKMYITNELTKTKNLVDTNVADLEKVQTPIKEKLKGILDGTISPAEQEAKLKKIKELQDEFYELAKQVQLNQFHEEEKQRSDGNSGIKQIRTGKVGSENYHSNSHTGGSFSAIHNHANNIRTVGMGEFIGVLNGIEFRTRHNDYRLRKPVTDNKRFHNTEDVTFPPVPPAVLNAGDVEAQVTEMREWFKAFHNQDYSKRDYRKYFKPILVYLEGAWTSGKAGDKVDEPFESDRHEIDAKSWLDLQEKVRFTSYHGSKSLLENLAHLPTKIIRFTEDKQPILAQWNYRILCHEISKDIPTNNLKLMLDPAAQMRNGFSEAKYRGSRAARFDIEGIDINGKRTDQPMEYSFLDSIMEEVPGKDNYGANITAQAFDSPEDKLYCANPNKKDQELNAGYYHRVYIQKDKNGQQVHLGQRGFSDRLYVAHTTQDRVSHVSYDLKQANGVPKTVNTKVSYAIPVEIIYLTSLSNWNPYNVPRLKDGVKETGTGTNANPLNGWKSKAYHITPHSFFSGEEASPDPADTAKKGALFVKTANGIKSVRSSGTRIVFPMIKGIEGNIRQRYPVMSIFGEGSAVWKKVNALEDTLERPTTIKNKVKEFLTGNSHSTTLKVHNHEIAISEEDFKKLLDGTITSLVATSEKSNGHNHVMTIEKDPNDSSKIYVKNCGQDEHTTYEGSHPNQVCFDYHENTLEDITKG